MPSTLTEKTNKEQKDFEKAFVSFKQQVSKQRQTLEQKVNACDNAFLCSISTADLISPKIPAIKIKLLSMIENAEEEGLYDFPESLQNLIEKIDNPEKHKNSLASSLDSAKQSAVDSKDSLEYPASNGHVTESFLKDKTAQNFTNPETLAELQEYGEMARANNADDLADIIEDFVEHAEKTCLQTA